MTKPRRLSSNLLTGSLGSETMDAEATRAAQRKGAAMNKPFAAGREVGHADAVTLSRFQPSQNPHLRTPHEPKSGQREQASDWADGYTAGWIDGCDGSVQP